LERQVQAAVGKAIEKHQARVVHMQKQELQRELKQDRRPRTARIG
jgi:putative DNA primase/helicase